MCSKRNSGFTLFYHFHFRMDAIPSAHLRQQKLEHQRQLIEQKQKQKRPQQYDLEDMAQAVTLKATCHKGGYRTLRNMGAIPGFCTSLNVGLARRTRILLKYRIASESLDLID